MAIADTGVGVGWGPGLNTKVWPDPFMDYASLAMPTSMAQVLRWAEFIFLSHGTYREATRRLVTYFITDLEIEAENDDNQQRWKEYLEETLDYRSFLNICGMDLKCYGNSFVSVLPVYIRYLACPNCGQIERPFQRIYDDPQFRFRWANYKFCADCPICKHSGAWRVVDRPAGEHVGFRLKRWNPHDIDIRTSHWSGSKEYIWKIPDFYRKQVRDGLPHVLAEVPLSVINTIKNGNNFMFSKGFIHHMAEDALAGVNDEGWGITQVLTNFKQAWYCQVLHRYNEAIALDYVIPFRLLTPAPGDKSTGADVLLGQDGGYMQAVAMMFRRRMMDPAAVHSLPFPVQYQSLGGDAKALAPSELLNQGTETLLNNIGIPAELFRGSLTIQAMPTALRLMEASHAAIPRAFNSLLRFIVQQSSTMLRWPDVKVRLRRVSHADDANRTMSWLQLMMSGLVSKTSGFRSVGLDFKSEVRQIMADQAFEAEEQAKLQENMDHLAQAKQLSQPQGQPGQPGQPGDPNAQQPQGQSGQPGQPGADPGILGMLPQGPNVKISPQEQLSIADSMSSKLLGEPESQKDSDLIKLKQVNPNLHAIVSEMMEDKRNKAKTQGGAQVMQQAFGKAGNEANKIAALAARLLRRPRTIQLED